jgi:hypothetical protein
VTRLRSLVAWRASARHARALAIAVALSVCVPGAAAAQTYAASRGPHARSFEVTGGVVWSGGYDAGSALATLSRNPSTGSTPLTEFQTDSRVLGATGLDAHVGLYVARHVSAEATFQYSRPILRTRITGDFESAASVDADDKTSSYLVGGSVLYHFGDGRVVPFVEGGGGYLRQLHEGNTELLTGAELHAGGGLKYWLGTRTHRYGLRVDALASSRTKSIAFEQKRRVVLSFAAGLAYLF